MKLQKLWLGVTAGMLASCVLSSAALAGKDPLTEENRLQPGKTMELKQ